MPKISIKDLTVLYGTNKEFRQGRAITAIDKLSCEFNSKEFNVILGPSGCGKTTLLKCIAGLEAFYEGEIIVDNDDYTSLSIADKNIGYVSQEYILYPHLTIFDNIAFPLKNKGLSNKEIIAKVYEISEDLNLMSCLTRKPRHISGGQQQRVAIARALVKSPDILLLDEPFSNIDEALRFEYRQLLRNIANKYRITVIFVTHNIEEATSLADKIFVMDQGKMIFDGTVKEFQNSHNKLILELTKELRKEDVI